MEGILLSLDREEKRGQVDTRNDKLGKLTIYFREIPDGLKKNCTVSFDVVESKAGKPYAKFLSAVDRNQARFNTEDRTQWYLWGMGTERDFVEHIVPQLGIDLRINPQKATARWAIDLYDASHDKYADLKVQRTPFFTAGRYRHGEEPFDPTYTAVFNKKDYENYKEKHPDCDVYFWVCWTQLEYKGGIRVEPLRGVWRAPFAELARRIESGEAPLHEYIHRKDDDHNARCSYLFNLLDADLFERLL